MVWACETRAGISKILQPDYRCRAANAPAGNEDPFANEIDEGFFIQRAFEQLKGLAHSQVNDGVQGLAFDFLAREPGKSSLTPRFRPADNCQE